MHIPDNAPTPISTRVERFETIVIGAGQAGLAAGYFLSQADADFVLLDAGAEVGEQWRNRWDSLRLTTPAAFAGLPGMPFPAPPDHLPDKDEVADYLSRYADRFDLPVRLRTRVSALRWNGTRYRIETGTVTYEADNVIIASGAFHAPSIPALAARLSPDILQLHSNHYRSPFDLPDGPVLVVGAGSAGAHIALELARFQEVHLSGRAPGFLPRRLLGRDIYAWLWPLAERLTMDTVLGRRWRDAWPADPLVGISEARLAGAGVTRHERLSDVHDGRPVLGGTPRDIRTVVWATGSTPDLSWLHVPGAVLGNYPRMTRGVAVDSPGLYFVGLRYQYRRTSSLLGGVGADAAHVVRHLLQR